MTRTGTAKAATVAALVVAACGGESLERTDIDASASGGASGMMTPPFAGDPAGAPIDAGPPPPPREGRAGAGTTMEGGTRSVSDAAPSTDASDDGVHREGGLRDGSLRDAADNIDAAEVDNREPDAAAVSFSLDVQPIFTAKCATAGCHVSGTASAGLVLADGTAYLALIGEVALQGARIGEPTLERVDPTNHDLHASYLWRKIESPLPADTFGTIMPPRPAGPLTHYQRAVIGDWIAKGAPQN